MKITELQVERLRCLQSVRIEPEESLNFVVGDNASGKTSLLEAIYLAGRAESFRHGNASDLIQRGGDDLTVFARFSDGEREGQAGIRRSRSATEIRIDGEKATTSELVTRVAVQLLDPTIHRLLEDGPNHRRRFLDWGVFHVEHSFLKTWRRFNRALKQRNRAIKKALDTALVSAWDTELADTAARIDDLRREYIEALRQRLPAVLENLGAENDLRIEYRRGWPEDVDYEAHLQASLGRDIAMGHTRSGPHRADLVISMGESILRDAASRGQQKLITAGLLLAQADLLYLRSGRTAILLFDDLAAELGDRFRDALLEVLSTVPAQCFVTALDADALGAHCPAGAMFHVEHGQVRRKGNA